MRRLVLLLGVLLALCAAVFLAPAASAGGPTSVLLVWDDGRSASLTYADPAYEQLMTAIGVEPGTPTAPAQPPAGEPTGGSVTVTWLLHDVQVWRVDEVFPAAPGGPVVGTRLVDLGAGGGYPELFARTPSLHGSADPGALVALLDELGGNRTAVAAVSPVPVADPAGPVRDEVTPAEPADGRLWWGIAGVLVGALAVTAVHRTRAPAARTEPDGESPKITVLSRPAPAVGGRE